MSKLAWYWHRLRAMSPGEIALHVRKKLRQKADANRSSWPEVDLACSGAYPKLPRPADAPEALQAALRRDAEDILAGRWRFFGHLELQVDDPPKWQCDYLVRRDFETNESAFKLNYRTLSDGADSKVIWEPSRWYQLVRLAMAAYVLGDRRAGEKCVEWLEDWVRHNPPYRGWNWTSALEVGVRLIQFAWIDALLTGAMISGSEPTRPGVGGSSSSVSLEDRLARLRREILPSHVWYAWRHKSFGSSANNHLLGELAGCIVATVRWPGLARLCQPIGELAAAWRLEVYSQFAEDGGNKEQALGYQLFAWELCWQAHKALEAALLPSGPAEQRLAFAARFFWEAQARVDHWDYGDSDNAVVVPVFAHWSHSTSEWHKWFEAPVRSPALNYWLGDPPTLSPPIKRGRPLRTVDVGEWWLLSDSRIAIAESGYWWMRWDLSPLGFLKTAAHGH